MGVGSIMCGYNQVNTAHNCFSKIEKHINLFPQINNSIACQNSYILNGILKDELGFQGFVMSDCMCLLWMCSDPF